MSAIQEAEGTSARDKRLSIPFTGQDLDELARLRRSPAVLRALPGAPAPESSEAGLVRAVFEAGMERARELADVAGYEALAEDDDYRAYHEARQGASPRHSVR
jgi:hypothetical protein